MLQLFAIIKLKDYNAFGVMRCVDDLIEPTLKTNSTSQGKTLFS